MNTAIEYSDMHVTVDINPLPQSLPRWEREVKPFSLRGKGWEGGEHQAPYDENLKVA